MMPLVFHAWTMTYDGKPIVFWKTRAWDNEIMAAGYMPVGSYMMKTMVWRDLDFERTSEAPDWRDHLVVGQALAATGWPWRMNCVNAYRDPYVPGDHGLYWGIRACHPQGGPTWKLDLWTARPGEFTTAERRTRWHNALTAEARLQVLALKEVLHTHSEYRKSLLSVHIYEAVLEEGIRGFDKLWAWWQSKYAPPHLKEITNPTVHSHATK